MFQIHLTEMRPWFADLSEDEMGEILNEAKNNLSAGCDKPVKLKTGKVIKIQSIKYDQV